MKIGIITFHAAINYGAVLQTYALVRCLKQTGHDPEVINYGPTPKLRGDLIPCAGLFGLHPADYAALFRRYHFKKFRRRFIPETENFYLTAEALSDLSHYDAYICGSDQIWNPDVIAGKLDPAYFLSFAPKNVPRIAYAASVGGKGFASADENRLRELLSNLTSVSVREKPLVEPVERLSGKSVTTVVDPTLLPVDYSELIRRRKGDYILLYALQRGGAIYRNVNALAKVVGLPIINLGSSINFLKHPGRPYWGSPGDFVSLIHGARFVVTNSFHGTVFSVIFKRPFISCALEGSREGRNVRMKDFLSSTGLTGRFYEPDRSLEKDFVKRAESINWKPTDEALGEMRRHSVHFLNKGLCNGG